MSTNPQVLLIVGIRPEEHKRSIIVPDDDVQSKRLTYHVYDHSHEIALEPKPLYDYLWYGSPMTDSPEKPGDVVGYIVDRIDPYSWIARALMHISECGNDDMLFEPPLDEFLCQREMYSPRWDAEKIKAEHRNVLNFGGSYGLYNTDIWWQFAMYLLKQAGWDIERTDLRMYLVMDWA